MVNMKVEDVVNENVSAGGVELSCGANILYDQLQFATKTICMV